MKSVVIANDTSNGHAGCKLVMQTIEHFCEVNNWNVIHKQKVGTRFSAKDLPTNDLVIVNGEGTIHDDKGKDLIDIAKYHKAVLINAVYQNNTYTRQDLERFCFVSARESLSAEKISNLGVNCVVVPDLSLYNSLQPTREPSVDVLVLDSVVKNSRVATQIPVTVPDFVGLVSDHKRVCSGRFHGALVAAMLGKPFSCYPSNTHKTLGILKDMGCEHLYFNSIESALANIPLEIHPNILKYLVDAKKKIEWLCKELKKYE